MHITRLKAGLLGGLLGGFLFLAGAHGGEPRTVQVLSNVYTVVADREIAGNSTFILTDEGVIVIDTGASPAAAGKLVEEIRKRSDQPIRFAINTSYRGGHTFGNQVLRESATLIAHKNVITSMGGNRGIRQRDYYRSSGVPGLDALKITLPNLIYEKSLELFLGGNRLQLFHFGRGNSDGDTAVFLKDHRVLIAGDLVHNKHFPFMDGAYIEDWIATLKELEDLDAEVIVPGHGDVGQKPVIILMKHYLLELKHHVLVRLEANKSLKETVEEVRPILLAKFGGWKGKERIDGNIRRAYMEYSLRPKDDSRQWSSLMESDLR